MATISRRTNSDGSARKLRLTIMALLSPERLEGRAELGSEELRLLPGREMSAPVDLVAVYQVAIGALGPALRRPVDVPGKDRDGDRQRDLPALLRGRARRALSAVLPVEARR